MQVRFIFHTHEGRREEVFELEAIPRVGELVRTSWIAAIRVTDVTWLIEQKVKYEVTCTHAV